MLIQAVRRAAENLSPRQKKILDWHLAGDSVKAISERLGVAPARVSDEKYRAIQKIRSSVNVS